MKVWRNLKYQKRNARHSKQAKDNRLQIAETVKGNHQLWNKLFLVKISFN